MGHRRTLLRQMTEQTRPTKKNRVGGHKITEARGTQQRRSTPELRGTKTFLARIGVPDRIVRDLVDDVLYDARYHFTKGWRVARARTT